MRNIVVVDIDGTITNDSHRQHFLEQKPKDWNSYFSACDKDEPIKDVINLVNGLAYQGYSIIFCTGRREKERGKTTEWILKHINVGMSINPILMRQKGDYRHDTFVKPILLEKFGVELNEIAFVLEDRNSMVKKWRELGLTCLQVAEGDF